MKKKPLIIGTGVLGLALAAFGPAVADKLASESLQAKCNPDWGPSTQFIDGKNVLCNMKPVNPAL